MMGAQWFKSLGKCVRCGRAATGELMSHVNASLGPHCQSCANAEIRKDHKLGKFLPDKSRRKT